VERGSDPVEAVAQVRDARPGTIETSEQERHVREQRPLSEKWRRRADRVLGCLLGGALGDGLGAAVEFQSLGQIRAVHGGEGIRAPVYKDGVLEVTDDTQMTLFTAEALLRFAAPPSERRTAASLTEEGWQAYRRWLVTQAEPVDPPLGSTGLVTLPALHKRQAPGNTCLSALESGSAPPADGADNDSKGCGGVMRVAPVGLVMEPRRAFGEAMRLAGLTHGHPTGRIASGAMAAMVASVARQGRSLGEAAEESLALCREWPHHEETVSAVERSLEHAASTTRAVGSVAELGRGWVAEEALAIGLFAALRGRSLVEVLPIAVNHGGDSDSTGSIAGQLYGAAHGMAGPPMSWIRRLDVLVPLVGVGRALTELS
jgi:ADP-ribosylglycohydrolase